MGTNHRNVTFDALAQYIKELDLLKPFQQILSSLPIGTGENGKGLIIFSGITEKKGSIVINDGRALGTGNIAIGSHSYTTGSGSVAIGIRAGSEGPYAFSLGKNTKAYGECSYAQGESSIALAKYAHAEGSQTEANGESSHAEGKYTEANGNYSHAEGNQSKANGNHSHAEGNQSKANGNQSHAEGNLTEANGYGSHSEGLWTKANGSYQHVSGKYNIEDNQNTYAEIIGNGTSSARSNARTLDWQGNEWLAGDLIAVDPHGYHHRFSEIIKALATMTITFDANTGTGTMETAYIMPNESFELPACDFTAPTGYQFAGWNTAAGGTGTSYAIGDPITISSNTTLYAQWEQTS